MARAADRCVRSVDKELDVVYLEANEPSLSHYSSIDDATRTWLNTLHYTWGLWKKSEGVTKMLTDYFNTAPNPYLSALRILVNISDFKYIKSRMSLGFTVAEDFSKWISPRKETYRGYLTPDMKLAAFKLLSRQKNLQLSKIVYDTYELPEHKDLFLPMIQDMMEEKKYKDAAQYATILQLQSHFLNPGTLLLPLILQNKLTIVDDLLASCEEAREPLVTYLDNLLAPSMNMEASLEAFVEENQIPEVKMSTMQMRPMNKLVGRLTKQYNLPPELCPNLNLRRGEGALKFLIYKRYVDCTLAVANALGGESWNEMARETVGTDSRLHYELVKSLAHANDVKEALRWAKDLKMPREQWPWALIDCEEMSFGDADNGVEAAAEENWDIEEDTAQYHSLQLPKEQIKVVDNVRTFENFLRQGLNEVTIVGIDSEWKPSFGTKQSDLALIQIATKTTIYILDVIGMGKKFTNLWTELGLTLFDNKNILKLGFGLAHDMAMIRESLPASANIKKTGQGYMDLLHLWRKLTKEHSFQFPHKGDKNFTNESLSKLVELCMGHRLNKSDQFSNWERRPLRDSQLVYAALDAYCLLEIFEVLRSQCARLDVAFNELCAETQHIVQKLPKKNTRKHASKVSTPGIGSLTPLPVENSVERPVANVGGNVGLATAADMQAAHEWRVVCDSMLGGLARQLRMCGCDCVYVEFDRRGDQSAKIATRQKRVLLTRGGAFNRFAPYVPQGCCYKVLADRPEDQLKEVLNHFKVLVMQGDIFSRCQICNHDEFVQVSRSTITELGKSFGKLMQRNGHRLHLNSSTEMDNATAGSPATDESDSLSSEEFKLANNKRGSVNNRDRTWQLTTETIDAPNCCTRHRVTVQVDRVPANVLKNVEQFYICECCGKVYWDGSHMEQALNGVLRDIIAW